MWIRFTHVFKNILKKCFLPGHIPFTLHFWGLNRSYGLHGICDDVVHLQHDQSYVGYRQLLAFYWMNLVEMR